MHTQLNEDVYIAVFEYVDDLTSLRSAVEAISISKTHPWRNVLCRRLLQRRFRLSSGALEATEALIEFLLDNSRTSIVSAGRIKTIELSLGPSLNEYDDGQQLTPTPGDARRLVGLLPRLFSATTNLRHLTWTKIPFPNVETLQVLAELPRLESFSVDCATGLWPARSMEETYEYWMIEPLFSTLGPKLISLELHNVNEETFRIICDKFSSLKKLQNLRLDISCEPWIREQTGSLQQGPSEEFIFPQIGMKIRSLGLIVSDTTVSPRKAGPLSLVDTTQLEELVLYVNHGYHWASISRIWLFTALSATDFSSLVHLELEDSVWDQQRWVWEQAGHRDRKELGRAYFGLHEFVSQLPRLRHLWVDERCLVIPLETSSAMIASRYNLSMNLNMIRTMRSPQWVMLGHTFKNLDSLRVGFGPMSAYWLKEVLKNCNPNKLQMLGFDWDWKAFGKDQHISSELLDVLANFSALTDLHILHPRPDSWDLNMTVSDVQRIFKARPNLLRVGMGRNLVWERRTPGIPGCNPDGMVPVQLLGNGKATERVPKFFNGGSGRPGEYQGFFVLDEENISEENTELLNLLKQCSFHS